MSQKKHAGYTVDKNKSLQSAVSLTYDAPFLKGLQAKGTIAYDSYSVFNKNLWKSYRIYSSDLNYQLKNKPRIANNVEDADRIVLQAQVTFDRTFLDKHHVSALVAYEQKKYEKKHSYLKREYDFYTTDVMDYASGYRRIAVRNMKRQLWHTSVNLTMTTWVSIYLNMLAVMTALTVMHPAKDGRSLLLYQPAGESLKKALSKIIFRLLII